MEIHVFLHFSRHALSHSAAGYQSCKTASHARDARRQEQYWSAFVCFQLLRWFIWLKVNVTQKFSYNQLFPHWQARWLCPTSTNISLLALNKLDSWWFIPRSYLTSSMNVWPRNQKQLLNWFYDDEFPLALTYDISDTPIITIQQTVTNSLRSLWSEDL